MSHGTYVRLFADDCLAYRRLHSDQDQLVILQQDLTALQNWPDRWGVGYEIYIIPRYDPGFTRCAVKAKYLGVLISNDLSCHEQICKVAAKANTTPHFITRNPKHCPRSMRQTAYLFFTRSGMEYCSSVWDPHLQKDKVRLEKVNKRAASVVFNRTWRDPNVSPTALLHQLHISTTCCPAKFSFFPQSIPEWNQLDKDIFVAPFTDPFRSILTKP